MNQHEDANVDTSADYSAALSPLGGAGGGGDESYSFGYLNADRALEVNPAVALQVDSDSDDDDDKKKSKKSKTIKAAEPVKLVALPVDAMATTAPSTHGIETGKWSTGLCNCFDFCVPNCCMVTFCPCFSAAQIATRLGFAYQTALAAFGGLVAVEYILYCIMFATIHTTDVDVDYYYGYYYYSDVSSSRLTVWGYLAFLLSVVLFIAYWQLRTKVRERFQLPGSCVEDFFLTFCCSCCALAQMATHVKSYKPHSCDFGAPDELPAYDA